MRQDQDYFPIPIEIASLLPDQLNHRRVSEGVEVVVFSEDNDRYFIARDICPHMGAPLAQARLCRKTGTLQCRWHGYIYDSGTGEMKENPNDKLFTKIKTAFQSYNPLSTPKYRIKRLSYEAAEGKIFVRRGAANET